MEGLGVMRNMAAVAAAVTQVLQAQTVLAAVALYLVVRVAGLVVGCLLVILNEGAVRVVYPTLT